MMSIQVIGISGKAGSGKDFIANNIIRHHGFYIFSLAWHFKVGLVGKGTATHEEVFKTKPAHVRKLLQLEGTEYGRNTYGPDIWCRTVEEWFHVLSENWGIHKFVVPDIRFHNEVEFVRRMGGAVYRINAPVRVENSGLSVEARQHPSEIDLDGYDGFDGYIYNDVGVSVASLEMQFGELHKKFMQSHA